MWSADMKTQSDVVFEVCIITLFTYMHYLHIAEFHLIIIMNLKEMKRNEMK